MDEHALVTGLTGRFQQSAVGVVARFLNRDDADANFHFGVLILNCMLFLSENEKQTVNHNSQKPNDK